MNDERPVRYAELLVGTCVPVQPGWEVLVVSMYLGGELVQEDAG
ncbi:MAG TPA: hypothetical protein VLJ76_06110 [Gaiellaceae bacterium]|nr:hypothetical protein [Gaiellaceae bacterium]